MHFTNRSLERKLILKIYECNASWWKRVYCWCTTQTMAESKEEKAHEEPCLTYKRCPHHSKKPLACSHFTLLICHCGFCSVDMKEMTKYLFPFFFTVWLNMGNLWLSTRSELAFRFSYVIQPAGGQCWCSEHYVAHIQKKIHCVTKGVYNELFYRTLAHTSGKVCCDYRGHGLWAIPRNTPLSLRNMTNISWLLSPKHSGAFQLELQQNTDSFPVLSHLYCSFPLKKKLLLYSISITTSSKAALHLANNYIWA